MKNTLTDHLRPVAVVMMMHLLCPCMAHAATVVAPSALTNTEGNSNNAFPFGTGQTARYQQVFGSSEFSLFAGPQFITQIAFRPEGDPAFGGPFSATIPSIELHLSTTSAAPDALSTTLASNVGANDTVVFSGSLALSSNYTGPSGGPKDFDIVINLQTPFLYNPALGNLLLDVKKFSQFDGSGAYDAQNSTGDSISRVFKNDVTFTAGTADSFGLVTRFTTVVPEPSVTSILLGGGLLLCRRLRRERPPRA